MTAKRVQELVEAGRYSEAVRELQGLPREARLGALLRCRDYLASFGERVRLEAPRTAATQDDAFDTLLALEGAELVEAEAASVATVRAGLKMRWDAGWQPAPRAEQPAGVRDVVQQVGAAVAQQGLADRFQAIADGATHAREIADAEALSDAEAQELMAAVQAEALRVGGTAADAVAGDAAREAYRTAKAAEREGKRGGAFLTLRVPQALADRLDAAAALLPSEGAPPAGWVRSAVHRVVLVAGLDALERKAKRGDR